MTVKHSFLLLVMMFAAGAKISFAQKLTFQFKGAPPLRELMTFELADKDFPEDMSWDIANKACQDLGEGWRLPNKEEMIAIYEQIHKKGKGNFKKGVYNDYWCSSESNANDAWDFNFDGGKTIRAHGNYTTFSKKHVRAIRALPANVGGNSHQFEKKLTFEQNGRTIEVTEMDFPEYMNWIDANQACNGLGKGWRLPNIEELQAMNDQLHLKGMGNFRNDSYWSSSERDTFRLALRFRDGKANHEYIISALSFKRRVRAVRTSP